MNKRFSAGVIITDGENIILGHSSGNKFWDLPKGKNENGETPKETAIRETMEEFGYKLDESLMIDLGRFKYNKEKDLHLFLYKVDVLPNIDELYCISHFDSYGKELQEIDDFKSFLINEAHKFMCKSLRNLFTKNNILTKYKE